MKSRFFHVVLLLALWAGWCSQSTQAQTKVVCIGDSITAGYAVSVSYPTRLANNTGFVVINAGVGGQTAARGLTRIDGLLAQNNPAFVLILYGTNDINSNHNLKDAAHAVLDIALRTRTYGAVPVIGTIPPMVGPRSGSMSKVQEFNGYLRSYASANSIALADIQAAFGSGSGLFVSDGFHPNDQGAEIIAHTFANQIMKSLWLSPASVQVQDIGALGQTFLVNSPVAWTAAAHQPWITFPLAGNSGSGNGTVIYNVGPNTGAARTGTITVAAGGISQTFTVKQDAVTLSVSPSGIALPGDGATGCQIAVGAHFSWTATSDDPSWIQIASGASGSGNGTTTINVASNAGGARAGTITFSIGETSRTLTVNQWPASTWGDASPADFDGDGTAEPAGFQPSAGSWSVLFGNSVQWRLPFGWSEVVPVPADYDGDGLLDFGVYHPATGNWYILESTSGQTLQIQFGWSAAIPLPGDYDGDGVADLAVFYPAEERWYFLCSTAGRYSVQWGFGGVVPVPADYDGDGIADIGVYHPASGIWYILLSNTGTLLQKTWGWSDAIPVPADYDGDGLADIAVFHRAAGNWYLSLSSGGTRTVQWGFPGVVPVPADYDGDGTTDIGVYHPASGGWYILQSSTGTLLQKQLGSSAMQSVLLYPMIHSWFQMP
jgi:lysophospholipase L1-like esterase